MKCVNSKLGALLLGSVILGCVGVAQTIDPYYASQYSILSLGSPPGVPSQYGGLCLKRGTNNILLIGGYANSAYGEIYEIEVHRDVDGHIDGFVGDSTVFASAEYNDGGLTYAPGSGVLFASRWPVNQLGQYKPGSVAPDKIIDLYALSVEGSHAAINFAPANYPTVAGHAKLVSWAGGAFYDATISPDGLGTYDISTPTFVQYLPGGPEGFIYVPPGSPLFTNGFLVSEYSAGLVTAYEVDSNANPILSTRRVFVDGLSGAEGAFVDPITGDFLFSTFGGGQQVVVVRGFATPSILSGSVDLQDYSASPAGVQAVIEVRAVGSTTPLEVHNVLLDANGEFAVQTAVAADDYDVACKPSHWLRHTLGSVTFTATGASVSFDTVNGDVDGDNEVAIGDYALLSSAYGSFPGDGNWNPQADLDGDEEVAIGDFAILSSNYGMFGDD